MSDIKDQCARTNYRTRKDGKKLLAGSLVISGAILYSELEGY